MSENTVEVIDRGLKCLSDHLGAAETEVFIATILRERFDYTTWRRTLVDSISTFEQLDSLIENSQKKDVFAGHPEIIL